MMYYAIIFFVAFILGIIITSITLVHQRDAGNLVINNDPEKEFFSLELKNNPNDLLKKNHKFVLLWITLR